MEKMIQSKFYSSEREILGEVVPLSAPYRLAISINEVCNFRCNYCFRSVKGADTLSTGYSDKPFMDFSLFENIIEQARHFPNIVKKVFLNVTAEPLMHKELPEMIKCAKVSLPKSKICIQTNGYFLTKKLSEQIAESGLDDMLISLQGLTAETYHDVCGVEIDFKVFVENIRYLFLIKEKLNLYIKIPNIVLEEGDESIFYDIFNEISDQATVEYITPVFNEVDYTKINGVTSSTWNRLGGDYGHQDVCSIPFYGLTVTTNGNVYPCVQSIVPITYGNVKNENLVDIWNGKVRIEFLKNMLRMESIPLCDKCTSKASCILAPEDIITPYANKILDRMNNAYPW